jgi:hypothetical protein
MNNLLVRGWIFALFFMQIGLAARVPTEPAAAVTPTPVADNHHHHHHHWTYVSRPLPSRGPCRAVYSSAVPSSIVKSVSSVASVSSSATASSSPVSIPHSRPVHSHSPRPHWSYTARPLPHRSSDFASSSLAAQTSSELASTPAIETSTAILETIPVPSSTLQPTGSIPKGTTTGLGTSLSQVDVSTATSDRASTDVTSASGSLVSGAAQSSIPSGPSTLQLTTSTVLSTRTATITACPTTVPNCPASSKTTFVTTETIVVSTTICPVTEAAGATQTGLASHSKTGSAGDYGYGGNGAELTTSTVYSTRTATITACPSSVTNCPLRSKTTYLTTETLVVSTTICPVADTTSVSGAVVVNPAGLSSTTEAVENSGNGGSKLTISTIFATYTATILACPESETDCPLRLKTSSATTQTVAIATTVYAVAVTQTPIPAEVTGKATVPVTATNNQASYDTSASNPKASSEMDASYTTTIVVESCSDDDTCTVYTHPIVVTQTSATISAATSASYINHWVSGAGNNRTISASSTPDWPQTSQSSGMITATVSATISAVSPLYTGAASARAGWSMVEVVGSVTVILAALVAV